MWIPLAPMAYRLPPTGAYRNTPLRRWATDGGDPPHFALRRSKFPPAPGCQSLAPMAYRLPPTGAYRNTPLRRWPTDTDPPGRDSTLPILYRPTAILYPGGRVRGTGIPALAHARAWDVGVRSSCPGGRRGAGAGASCRSTPYPLSPNLYPLTRRPRSGDGHPRACSRARLGCGGSVIVPGRVPILYRPTAIL